MTPIWDDRVAQWVANAIPGCSRGFGKCRALGVLDDGELVAGVVFHNWSPEDRVIEISAASVSAKWMTRPVMDAAFTYAFDGADCDLVVARIHEKNTRARRLWRGLGADEFLIPRVRAGAAEAVYTFGRDQWEVSRFRKGT